MTQRAHEERAYEERVHQQRAHEERRYPAEHHHRKKRWHHSWQLWFAVLLMLLAMGTYLATMDESIRPAEKPAPAAH